MQCSVFNIFKWHLEAYLFHIWYFVYFFLNNSIIQRLSYFSPSWSQFISIYFNWHLLSFVTWSNGAILWCKFWDWIQSAVILYLTSIYHQHSDGTVRLRRGGSFLVKTGFMVVVIDLTENNLSLTCVVLTCQCWSSRLAERERRLMIGVTCVTGSMTGTSMCPVNSTENTDKWTTQWVNLTFHWNIYCHYHRDNWPGKR